MGSTVVEKMIKLKNDPSKLRKNIRVSKLPLYA